MFTEAQNSAIVKTELDTVFFQSFAYDATDPGIVTAQSGMLFKPLQTTHAAYIGEVNKSVGLWSQVGEIQTIPTQTPHVTNKYTIQVGDFASSIDLSKDLFDDNMHGVWSQEVTDFALKGRVTQDNSAMALFRNSFTTTLTADGVSAVNSAHPLIGGGFQSNSGTAALSPDSLNQAIINLRTQKDQAGTILGNVPSILLVPPELFKHAKEITDSVLIADSANNNLNVYRSAYGIVVMTSPYLGLAAGGSATAWWLLAKSHSVTRLIRQGIETALRPWQYSNNRTYLYQGNFREQYFVPDYAGLYGSLGTT